MTKVRSDCKLENKSCHAKEEHGCCNSSSFIRIEQDFFFKKKSKKTAFQASLSREDEVLAYYNTSCAFLIRRFECNTQNVRQSNFQIFFFGGVGQMDPIFQTFPVGRFPDALAKYCMSAEIFLLACQVKKN